VAVFGLAECDYAVQVFAGLVVVDHTQVGDFVDERFGCTHNGDVFLLEPDGLDLRPEGQLALQRLALVVPHDDLVVGLARIVAPTDDCNQVAPEYQLHDVH